MEHTQRIHLLPSEVVDQIAAGEVVERPAHLVKELVENALDAGATSIEIEYDQGGRRVRVTDDGSGITPEDLSLALARHATSKIEAANDLWNLGTFGFRGEALASIAAVSRLTLQSRRKDAATASRIVSEFGRLSAVEPTGGNPGTTILVEELFANIPARLKFLKSEAGENAQIKATLRALALANPQVEFRLRTKGKLESLWSRCESFLERTKQIVEGTRLYEARYEYNGYQAQLVFASPHDVTGNARSILIFVQDRWVQDRSLQAAVIEAYRGLLMHGEYPMAVVRLKAPPDEVDVNIHPTKSQVKFRDSQSPFRTVSRGLREALERAPWLEAMGDVPTGSGLPKHSGEAASAAPLQKQGLSARGSSVAAALAAEGKTSSRKLSVADLTRPYVAAASSPTEAPPGQAKGERSSPATKDERTPLQTETSSGDFSLAPVNSIGRFEAPEFNAVVFRQKTDVVSSSDLSQELRSSTIENSSASAPQSPVTSDVPSQKTGAWSRLQVLGQANLTYIVAQDEGRLVLVDQHAAHERVAYERLMRAWMSGGVEVQPLLLPITIDLEPDGAEALLSVSHELEKLGVQIDQIGPQSVAIRAVPVAIKESALAKALTDLAHEIVERGGSFALERKISDLCATMACHSVVRAGQALSHEQMRSLLLQMDEFPLSSFCPHGRPVSVDYPFTRLERDFGRLV